MDGNIARSINLNPPNNRIPIAYDSKSLHLLKKLTASTIRASAIHPSMNGRNSLTAPFNYAWTTVERLAASFSRVLLGEKGFPLPLEFTIITHGAISSQTFRPRHMQMLSPSHTTDLAVVGCGTTSRSTVYKAPRVLSYPLSYQWLGMGRS